MSQFEQENDVGGGGGEVDAETMDDAWQNAAERRSTANISQHGDDDAAAEDEAGEAEGGGGLRDDSGETWANVSAGDKEL